MSAMPPFVPGQMLADRYRVERVLGVGGMGIVLAAVDVQEGQRVALKLPLPDDPEATARFVDEAHAVARISNDHVVRVLDVGVLESGVPFMAMEYLEGVDLSVWLARCETMEVGQAVDFVLQGCEAIAEVHTRGMVHCDVKPSNLFCATGPDGAVTIKLLDFGISAPDVRQRPDHAKKSTALGSVFYMSPEQVQAPRSVDARSDIWSLGIILYELLAGCRPFSGDSVGEVSRALARTSPVPLRSLRAGVPPALERVIARCLEKDRDLRFSTVGELAAALAAFASAPGRDRVERVLVRERLPSLPASEGGNEEPNWPPPSLAPWMTVGQPRPRELLGKATAWLGVAAIAALIAGVGALVLHGSGETQASRDQASAAAAPSAASAPPVASDLAAREVARVPTVPVSELPVASPRAASAAAPRAAPPAGSAAPVLCDPPYTIDGHGRTHFKLECFRKK